MVSANYEVCLLTSNVREAMKTLRRMVGPLHRLHHKALDCVEVHYSNERDALLLRLSFSSGFSDRQRQGELVQCLAERGFEVLESSEFSGGERARFEQLLREQYEVRVQQYPSAAFPGVVSRILDSLEAHLEQVAPKPQRRLTTIDADEHIIAAIPMFEVDVEGSQDAIELLGSVDDQERLPTVQDPSRAVADLPLRMETFGPLDDMIAKLPRAKTQDSLDAALDSLWP